MKRKTFLTALSLLPAFKVLAKTNFRFFSQSCKTERDQEGPFYKKGAPKRSVISEGGTVLAIQGKVFKASDCSTPVPNATIDIWHCDSNGDYDSQGFKCRGVVVTDVKGDYTFATTYPPPYGSRPRHIHFKVRAEGYPELTSQIYFKGDPQIKNDFAKNAASDRVIDVQQVNEQLKGQFNIYI